MNKKLVVSGFSGIRIVAALAAIFVVMTGPARADQQGADHSHDLPTHEQNVETMLELMSVPGQVNKVAADLMTLYSPKIDAANADPNVKKIVDAYQLAVSGIVNKVLGWDALKSTYIYSYANRLSADEVAAVSGFLLSPEGQKFSDVQQQTAVDIQQTTKHLAEADMAPALTELANQLRQGLAKLKNAQQNTAEK